MKHILAPILLVVFLFPSLALGEEVTWDDLVEREGLYYKKSTDVPFTGKVTGQGMLKNGLEEGPWLTYYDHDEWQGKGDYKNGNTEGPWVGYNEDGTVNEKNTVTYKNGKKVD